MKLLDLKIQYLAYQTEIDNAIKSVIDSTSFIGGKVLTNFEESLSNYTGAKHAIACSSGTDALLLCLMSLGIKSGDEVITTPFSFIATGEVIGLINAKTVFVDVEKDTYCIDPLQIEKKITPKTKAIIPVSLFGQVANMEAINEIASRHGIAVIEDAAQSFGASYKKINSCHLSDLAATSFFPAKPLGGYGDGGAVFTDDDELGNKVRMLLNHGQSRRYYHDYIGINGRLDTLQAAILDVKLKYLDEEITARNKIAAYYNQYLNQEYYTPQKIYQQSDSTYAQYCLTVNKDNSKVEVRKFRNQLQDKLTQEGIPNAVYYPVPIHLQKPFLELGYQEGDFPISELLSCSIFAIPVHPFLTEEERVKVVEILNRVF